MRLSVNAQELIKQTVLRETGANAQVFLFGSRLDDSRRGGDVDLYIESDNDMPPLQRARVKLQLEAMLGLPVDIVFFKKGSDATAFQRIAAARSVPL
jgi:predicted nucleotidyltransferase